MSEIEEAFTELMYGEGVWLGLLLYLTIIGLSSLRVKYLGVLYIPVSLLMALEYIDRATDTNNLFWCALIMLISVPFMIVNMWKGTGEM